MQFYFTREKLQQIVDGQLPGLGASTGIASLGLPEPVIQALVQRGHLVLETSQVEQSSDEDARAVMELCRVFAQKFAMFCVVFDHDPLQGDSIRAYMQQARENPEGKDFEIVSAVSEGMQLGVVSQEMLWEYIQVAAKVTESSGLRQDVANMFRPEE